MRQLWMRLGASFEVSEEEEKAILGGDKDLAAKTLRQIVREGRFLPDGDSYIPEDTVSGFNVRYGTKYAVEDIGCNICVEGESIPIYTIVTTGIDTDRGFFPDPAAGGSFLSLKRARAELNRLVEVEKETLSERYDCEDRGEDYWEAHQDGNAAALSSRIEILTSRLDTGPDPEV